VGGGRDEGGVGEPSVGNPEVPGWVGGTKGKDPEGGSPAEYRYPRGEELGGEPREPPALAPENPPPPVSTPEAGRRGGKDLGRLFETDRLSKKGLVPVPLNGCRVLGEGGLVAPKFDICTGLPEARVEEVAVVDGVLECAGTFSGLCRKSLLLCSGEGRAQPSSNFVNIVPVNSEYCGEDSKTTLHGLSLIGRFHL
jgi:hypothetical protein